MVGTPSFTADRDDSGRIVHPRIFTDEQSDEVFWRDGFVIVDLFDDEALGEFRRRFDDLHPADGFEPSGEQTSDYHCTFLDESLEYREDVDRLTHDLIDPRLGRLLVDYEVLTSNIYVKPPGRGRFEVHLNWITVVDPMATTLTIWTPLHDATAESGTIRVVPGSHKLFPDVATAAAAQYFAEFHQELIDQHLVPVELRAGQAVVFDDTLIHWSSENRAARPRVALQVEVVPRGAPTAVWVPDPDDDRWFLLYEMDRTFWLTQDKSVFYSAPDLPVISRQPNPNRSVTYEQFVDRLDRHEEIRARAYRRVDDPPAT